MAESRLDLAVITRQFPLVSETFILDHVTGLIERQHRVQIHCRTYIEPEHAHADLRDFDIRSRSIEWLPATSTPQKVLRGLAAAAAFPTRSIARSLAVAHRQLPRDTILLRHQLRRCLPATGIIHAHFAPMGEQLAFLKRCGVLHRPLAVSLHGFDVTRDPQLLPARYPNLFCGSDRIVVTTEFIARQALSLGCPPEKLVRSPIGIRPDRFAFTERTWTTGQTLRLLSTGRLVEKKGIEYAICALAVLLGRGIPAEYRIVGDGPLMPSLRTLAAELGIASAVTFCGALPRERVAEELSQCHIFLFPSVKAADGDQEGQGMALIEAQASGALCVATQSGGIPEVLRDGINGHLVPERNAGAIADAALALTARRAEWPGMARAGRAWVERTFSLRRHLDELERVYHQLSAAVRPA